MPELFKQLLVAERVHRLPKAAMLKGIELIHGGDAGQAVALPHRLIVFDQIKHLWLEHKEAAIDPGAIALGFFFKRKHPASLELQRTKTARGLHGSEGCPAAPLLVKGNGFSDVHIGDTVAIGEAEGVVAHEVGLYTLEASTGEGIVTRVNQGDAPGLGFAVVNLHLVGGHVEGDIASMEEIIRKIFLDQVAFVAKADNEVVDAVRGIDLEDVPENRQAPNFHHGLGP